MSIGKWNTIMNLMFKVAHTSWKDDFNNKIYNILLSIEKIERDGYRLLLNGRIGNGTEYIVHNNA